jgi:RNA polymerase sigma-70 factor (ECF subfamily)
VEQQRTTDQQRFVDLYTRQADLVYRVCYAYLRTTADAEDATQAVFMKLLTNPRSFASLEHEKAWLVRVAVNHCKDWLKNAWNRRSSLDAAGEPAAPEEVFDDTLELVWALPELQRVCVYLFYYEGYNAKEISVMIGKSHSTVRNLLSDARKALRLVMEGDDDAR